MKILVLTDHLSHSSENSFYGIVNQFLADQRVEEVYFGSRGCLNNKMFFSGKSMECIYSIKLNQPIYFPLAERLLKYSQEVQVNYFDAILLRLPWPVTADFFHGLKKIFQNGHILNDPYGILKTSDKAFLLNFQKWTPPLKICDSLDEILDFKRQGPCVLKPRHDYGGRGIIKLDGDSVWEGNRRSSLPQFFRQYKSKPISYLAMRYLKNVVNGDKRIVVANGRILSSSLRLPAKGSWVCNISQGGTSRIADPNPEEIDMIHDIYPKIKKEGIFLVGFDTLEGDDGIRMLSEINTLSVGGITPAERDSGLPVNKWLVDEFFAYLNILNEKDTL